MRGKTMELDVAEWVGCASRGPWARNSLKSKIEELRRDAKKIRAAYRKSFMAEPCEHIAGAYEDAANAIEARLDAIR